MSTDWDRGSDVRGWIVPGIALAVAAGLVVWTVASGSAPPASAPPTTTATAAGGSDDHEVQAASGVFSFGFAGSDLVVGKVGEPGAGELGRSTVPGLASAIPGQSPVVGGNGIFAIVCPSSGGDERFVFGWVTTRGATYTGPTAVGHIASDGAFLYVLGPGILSAPVAIGLPGASHPLVGLSPPAFDDARSEGVKQPSGCFVIG